MKSKQELQRIRRRYRESVPGCNRQHYEIVWEDFLDAVTPENYDKLKEAMWNKIKKLQSQSNMCRLPPELIRRDGESSADYLKRCWKKWGDE